MENYFEELFRKEREKRNRSEKFVFILSVLSIVISTIAITITLIKWLFF